MAEIKRLILGIITNQKCNLKCEFCYISQLDAWDEPTPLQYPVDHIVKCLSIERLGGVSLINLTGHGETMLQPDIVPLIGALLKEGHYVEVVTNGTVTKHINQVLEFPKEWLSRLFFKISFHYNELNRLNIMNNFFNNVKAIHEAGASFTLELMAYDGVEQDIVDIKKVCVENAGAVCQATIGRNDKRKDRGLLSEHSNDEFREAWSPLASQMLDYKLDLIGVKRKEFCYAGAWSLFVDLYTGESQPCYGQPFSQNIFKNPETPIEFVPVGHTCTQPYCINGHAHLAWGLIPELKSPFYSEMRNRNMKNGEEWLTKECNEFFSTKLHQSNEEFSSFEKLVHTFTYPFRFIKWFMHDYKTNIRRLMNYLKKDGN